METHLLVRYATLDLASHIDDQHGAEQQWIMFQRVQNNACYLITDIELKSENHILLAPSTLNIWCEVRNSW